MTERLRILVISAEVWNDKIHGNGVLSNWFTGFNADFANIYCSPGLPFNCCCKHYFQITDKAILGRVLLRKKLGYRIEFTDYPSFAVNTAENGELEDTKLYRFAKRFPGEIIRTVRELLWSCVNFDNRALNEFITDFDPHVIFCARKATPTILRLEHHVQKISRKPLIAFIADDDYSLRQLNFSPLFWVNRFILRKKLRASVSTYSIFYAMTDTQRAEYSKYFNRELKVLTKCGNFASAFQKKNISSPIRIVYAGKLYCGRDKVLERIGKALDVINNQEIKMTLEIYTNDKFSRGQKKILNNRRSTFVNLPVTPGELSDILKASDIAIHVESFKIKNRLFTRLSFSTKIIDYLASGCAVLAISWDKHAGYLYLKKEDAAILVGKDDDILPALQRIANEPSLIAEYAEKAWACGIKNHKKEAIQSYLYHDFISIASTEPCSVRKSII